MFALYYEQEDGRLNWIASCQEVRSARNVAQIYSTGVHRPVVCVYNAADGSTQRCYEFREGQELGSDDPFENPDTPIPCTRPGCTRPGDDRGDDRQTSNVSPVADNQNLRDRAPDRRMNA